jgi:hypothetical protein
MDAESLGHRLRMAEYMARETAESAGGLPSLGTADAYGFPSERRDRGRASLSRTRRDMDRQLERLMTEAHEVSARTPGGVAERAALTTPVRTEPRTPSAMGTTPGSLLAKCVCVLSILLFPFVWCDG